MGLVGVQESGEHGDAHTGCAETALRGVKTGDALVDRVEPGSAVAEAF